MMKKRVNWANVLTWTRLFLIAPITIAAFLQLRIVAAILFSLAQLTDFFDGFVARRYGFSSKAGARFDSQVDNIILPFLLLWFALLVPKLLLSATLPLVVFALILVLQFILIRIRLGFWSGLHLWSDKASAAVGAIVIFAVLFFGDTPWTREAWYVALIIGSISCIEGIVYVAKGGKNLDARWFFDK